MIKTQILYNCPIHNGKFAKSITPNGEITQVTAKKTTCELKFCKEREL